MFINFAKKYKLEMSLYIPLVAYVLCKLVRIMILPDEVFSTHFGLFAGWVLIPTVLLGSLYQDFAKGRKPKDIDGTFLHLVGILQFAFLSIGSVYLFMDASLKGAYKWVGKNQIVGSLIPMDFGVVDVDEITYGESVGSNPHVRLKVKGDFLINPPEKDAHMENYYFTPKVDAFGGGAEPTISITWKLSGGDTTTQVIDSFCVRHLGSIICATPIDIRSK